MAALPRSLRQYYQAWLQRRIPPTSRQQLHRKNIFIFPSKTGVGFLFTIVLLWLLGTNYQNNLVIMLSFLLLSLLHTCIFYSYKNFSGLAIEVKNVSPCFVGDTIKVDCVLKNDSPSRRKHHSILLGFNAENSVTVDKVGSEPQSFTLYLPATQRGLYHADRLRIISFYPLGLIRVWAKLDMDINVLVYPKPIKTPLPELHMIAVDDVDAEHNELTHAQDMNDDVSHIREYHAGDSVSHIAWKVYAKGQGLATKVYESLSEGEKQRWFHWDDFLGVDTEERLSRLCDFILQAEQKNMTYGLVLPQQTFPLSTGNEHKKQLLSALALFNNKLPDQNMPDKKGINRNGR